MRAIVKAGLISVALLGSVGLGSVGCTYDSRVAYPTTTESLPLERVVLYRNGVGYFERHGPVEGNLLRIKVRKDQINDLLKSLTVVDLSTGKAVSVSMPLDPQTWANAALATLAPRNGSLAEVLDLLRGVDVSLETVNGGVDGRIVMVEQISDEPDPESAGARSKEGGTSHGTDHKVTLMDENELRVVRLSKVKGVTLKDGDLAMQFHRRLDATAGEGMFQQVEVAIRLEGVEDHDLRVSYVVAAPMWKPTYRVVLPKDGKGQALLQAWAVVDNVSGEDWSNVKLSLTAGAPIAFQYDMHSPRYVERPDISDHVHSKRARVAMGETSYDDEPAEPAPEPELAAADKADSWAEGGPTGGSAQAAPPASRPGDGRAAERRKAKKGMKSEAEEYGGYDYNGDRDDSDEPSVTMEGLRRSTLALTKAKQASGLTRYEIGTPVTVPDGNSTMVALVNSQVTGEEVFMFDPNGGGGPGYEQNPFRVVRFKNSTPFVLESGPISIYSGGSFVGEGISDAVGANTSVTVPFAVEPSILVTSESPSIPQELRLLKIVRGTVHAERFYRQKTVWNVKAQNMPDGYKVLIRHPKQGGSYKLKDKIDGMEEVGDAYLVPIAVAKGKSTGSIEVIEQTPSQVNIGIFEPDFLGMLERALVAENFSAEERAQLKPLIELRREIGKLDTELESLRAREDTLNRRITQHRYNLDRLKDMKGAEAEKMRQERAKQLEQFTKEGDQLAQEMIRIEEKKGQMVIQLEEKLAVLTIGGN